MARLAGRPSVASNRYGYGCSTQHDAPCTETTVGPLLRDICSMLEQFDIFCLSEQKTCLLNNDKVAKAGIRGLELTGAV